jgi:hypothetical protein
MLSAVRPQVQTAVRMTDKNTLPKRNNCAEPRFAMGPGYGADWGRDLKRLGIGALVVVGGLIAGAFLLGKKTGETHPQPNPPAQTAPADPKPAK